MHGDPHLASQITCFNWWRCLQGASQHEACCLGMCSAGQGVYGQQMLQLGCRVHALGLAAAATSIQGPASYMHMQQQLQQPCRLHHRAAAQPA